MCNYQEIKEKEEFEVQHKDVELYPYPDIPTVNGRVYTREAIENAIKNYKRDTFYVDMPTFNHEIDASAYEVDFRKVVGTIDKGTIKLNDEGNAYVGILMIRYSKTYKNPILKLFEVLKNPVYTLRGAGNLKTDENGKVIVEDYTIISVSVFENQGQLK